MSNPASPLVFDVTEKDFEKQVLEASRERPVVVDFWAPWCGPCRMLGPILEKLVLAREGEVLLAKVNTDECQQLAASFGIEGIPAVKAIRDGRVVVEFVGVYPESQLVLFLDQLRPSKAESDLAEAAKTADPAEAEKRYRLALAEDANLDAARLGLARVLLQKNQLDEIDDLLEPFSAEGQNGEEAQRLKADAFLRRKAMPLGTLEQATAKQAAAPTDPNRLLDLGTALAGAGKYEEALARLLKAAELNPKLATSSVREIMVQVFYALGVRHPLADEYRRKLSELLY